MAGIRTTFLKLPEVDVIQLAREGKMAFPGGPGPWVICCAHCDKVLKGVGYEPARPWRSVLPRSVEFRECSGPLPGGKDVAVVKEAGKTKFVRGPLKEDSPSPAPSRWEGDGSAVGREGAERQRSSPTDFGRENNIKI